MNISYSQNYKLEYISTDNGGSIVKSHIITYYVKPSESKALQMVDTKQHKKYLKEEEILAQNEGKQIIDYQTYPVFWVLIDYKDNIKYSKSTIGKKNVIKKDPMPIIKWKITNETKEIAGFECTKAIGYYRGRNWIAWFTPQIPISLGVLSINGLPGLVLELEDESGRYHEKIKSIEPTNETFDAEWNAYQNTIKGIEEVYTLQRVFEENEAYHDAINSELKKNRNVAIKTTRKRSGTEMIYEWESELEKDKYQSLNK